MKIQTFLTPIILVLILAAAAWLRFYNLDWDNGTFAHPDERSTVAFYAPTIEWPENPDNLLDPRTSTLNPFWNANDPQCTQAEAPPSCRRSYTYGHFPLYLLVGVAHGLDYLAPLTVGDVPAEWTEFMRRSLSGQGFAQIGRALMALSDLGTVLLVFLIGQRLYGAWGGLLAAGLSAFTVLQIQLAHFFAVDPISTTFTALALYGAILMVDHKSIGAALLTGVGIGLAVASKFSALPVVFAPLGAALLVVLYHKSETTVAPFARMVILAALAVLMAFLVFAVTSPFVLLDFENFNRAVIEEQGRMVSGVADFPFTRQYRGTIPYLYFIEQQIQWGMGWPLGLLALFGTFWAIGRALTLKAQPGEWLLLGWVALYFIPTGLFLAKFMRYMIPIVPFLTLFGVGLLVSLWRLGSRQRSASQPDFRSATASAVAEEEQQIMEHQTINEQSATQPSPNPSQWEGSLKVPPVGGARGAGSLKVPPVGGFRGAVSQDAQQQHSSTRFARPIAVLLALIILTSSAAWSFAFVNGVYGTEHSWVTFSRWVYANVPDGSCIAWEHWDDRLPVSLPEPEANPGAHGYHQPQLPMYEEDTRAKYENLRATLMDCDYVVLATNRLWRTIPKLPERYPMSTRYYEALFSGELGFELVHTVETPPTLAGFSIDTQPADESFTVYDHPKPMIFQKVRQLTPAEWDEVLALDDEGRFRWEQAQPGYIGATTILMQLRGYEERRPPSPAADEERKSLMLDTPVNQLPVVDDFRWNRAANESPTVAIVTWWLAFMLVGLLAWPLTYLLCQNLPDRGYALSKSLGALLISYFVWLMSSFGWLHNRFETIILGLVILLLLTVWLLWQSGRDILNFTLKLWPLILVTELIFGLVYAFFIYLRIQNPDLWQPWLGGEKMLEIGFLNAIVKSAEMPPYDPFYAGGIINYYYYGMFIVGIFIKLTGIQPSIAFNLAIAMLAALTAVNAFSLARNLVASMGKPSFLNGIAAGILAVLFVVFMGNIEGGLQFMRNLTSIADLDFESAIPGVAMVVSAADGLRQVYEGGELLRYNYWDPTRVIPATINEFPYFSFLFADLHPHMMGIPFTILFLNLAFNVALGGVGIRGQELGEPFINHLPSTAYLLRWLALPFVLGAIAVINTWDLPTYLGIMLATFLLTRYRHLTGSLISQDGVMLLFKGIGYVVALLAMTYLLYWPFFANYQAIDVGLDFVHTQTPLDGHLRIWGLFIFMITSWLWLSLLYPNSRHSLLRLWSLWLRRWNVFPHLSEIQSRLVRVESPFHQLGTWLIIPVLVAMVALWWFEYYVPLYLLPLLALSLLFLFRRDVATTTSYVNLLIFTGLLLLLGVEIFVLKDFLGGGDYYRMNTLFKFYIQVWVLFGIGLAIILPTLWGSNNRWPIWSQLPWYALSLMLLLGSFIYPMLATQTRLDDRFPGARPEIGTLDGLAYMTVGRFEWEGKPVELRYDYEAINWLIENVEGTPILAEAKIGYYREGGMRVAAYTGLPSILGGLHQGEQRYADQIGQRDFPVNEFWQTTDPAVARQRMAELGIEYIYVGQVERNTYGANVGDKFEQLRQQGVLELVYENPQTKIYRRAMPSSLGS